MGKYFVEVDLFLDTANNPDGTSGISADYPNQCEVKILICEDQMTISGTFETFEIDF